MLSLNDKRILVIDDADEIRVFVKRVLKQEGAAVSEAPGVDEGLLAIQSLRPDLVITDLNLPGKTGFDFLAHRRNNPELAGLPTIVLSGRKDQDSVIRAIALGASDYLLKPIQSVLLLQKVRRWLRAGSFFSLSFETSDRPRATAQLGGDALVFAVATIDELGVRLISGQEIQPGMPLRVQGALFKATGAFSTEARTTVVSCDPLGVSVAGAYSVYAEFDSLSAVQTATLRRWLGRMLGRDVAGGDDLAGS